MPVIAKILDSRDEGRSKCYLCSIMLEDYVNGLSETYQGYEIQREIVSNVYLDRLVDTVIEKRHIPPIVLVVDSANLRVRDDLLEIDDFKILDGLQRTFRLQAIKATMDFLTGTLHGQTNFLELNKFKFSREFSVPMRAINSNTDILRSVLEGYNKLGPEGLKDTFTENCQWFEVWTGLSPDDEVRKMLTLNAGHKPVKTRHQLELLFLHLLPVLRSGKGQEFKLVREKEVSSTQFSKGRACGHFHFAHIIAALLSLFEGEPVVPSAGLIEELQNRDTGIEKYSKFLTPTFLADFVAFLVLLDETLLSQYGNLGVLWVGREVTLAGLFGALGALADADVKENGRQELMTKFLEVLKENPGVLNLAQFEEGRNSLDLSKVNFGNANRVAVFRAIKSLLGAPPKQIDWSSVFQSEGK